MGALWFVGADGSAHPQRPASTKGIPVTFLSSLINHRDMSESKHVPLSRLTLPPPPLSRSGTAPATIIHRCWILVASHKRWYAWFVQSASSVISFSFSFISPLPARATGSSGLLYERLSGWLHALCHGGSKEPRQQPKSHVKTAIWMSFGSAGDTLHLCTLTLTHSLSSSGHTHGLSQRCVITSLCIRYFTTYSTVIRRYNASYGIILTYMRYDQINVNVKFSKSLNKSVRILD